MTGSQAGGGYGFDPGKIWVTVLHTDDEAAALWENIAGLPPERISGAACSTTTGTWAYRDPVGRAVRSTWTAAEYGPDGGPVVDEDRFRDLESGLHAGGAVRGSEEGRLRHRPRPAAKNIDTGMGLERVAYLLQGVDNLYEIDQVYPVIDHAAQLAGKTYGDQHDDDVRLRVVGDHVRSGLMLITDGVTPATRRGGMCCAGCFVGWYAPCACSE